MNHVFRAFVEAYAVAITRSDYMDLSTSSLLIFPTWSHTLRFINQYVLIPFLPEPKLYSLQVKSEIRFRVKQFIDESTAALDRIDASSPSIRYLHNSTSLTQLLEAASDAIDTYQQKLHQTMDTLKAHSVFGFLFFKPKEISILDQYHALGNRVRSRIRAVKETAEAYEADSRRLMRQLHYLRKSFNYIPSFEFSPTGLVAVPASLLAQVQSPPFFWRRQSSNAGHDSGSSGINNITPHANVYYYDLDMINDINILTLRSAIVQLCRERKNHNIISGSLYMICNIWTHAITMSEFDNDVLSSVQRSWVLERLKAVRRYEKEIGTDFESVVNLVVGVYQDYQRGTPVPEHL